jgi:hypothetical protein
MRLWGFVSSCDKFELSFFSQEDADRAALGGTDVIQMRAELVTETQGVSSHAWPMSVVTSIAVNNIKACAERLVARASRLAQNPSADAAAERAKQTLDAVAFKANLGLLKMPNTKAKAILDIVA